MAAASTCAWGNPCIEDGLKHELDTHAEKGEYNTTRDLPVYEGMLGDRFSHDLHALRGPDAHWIDAGSGDGVAISAFAKDGGPKVTGVTLKLKQPLPAGSRAHVELGYIENLSTEALGRADLITDYYGALAYTDRPDLVLQKYVDLLKDDGVAYFYLGDFAEMNETKIELPSGGIVDLEEWIRRIPGLKVEVVKPKAGVVEAAFEKYKHHPDLDPRTLRITKLPGARPEVPSLKLNDAYFNPPHPTPIRELEQVAGPAIKPAR